MLKHAFLIAAVFITLCFVCSSENVFAQSALPKPLILPGDANGFYYSTDKNVYRHVCDGDDPECFILVPGADPKSFQMVDTTLLSFYAKDATHVYFLSTIVPNADPKTFKLINSAYAQDRSHVYYDGLQLYAKADRFKVIDAFFASDGRHVFWENKMLLGADTASFKVSNTYCGYDAKKVFCEGNIQRGLNPKTFDSYDSGISKDDQIVLCQGKKIQQADAKTFTILSAEYAKDKAHAYFIDRHETIRFSQTDGGLRIFKFEGNFTCNVSTIKEADPETFSLFTESGYVRSNFAIDSNHVYFRDSLIPEVTPKNFDPSILFNRLNKLNK